MTIFVDSWGNGYGIQQVISGFIITCLEIVICVVLDILNSEDKIKKKYNFNFTISRLDEKRSRMYDEN